MDTILRTIVEADRAARAETDAARRRRENLSAELSESKKQIDKTYRLNAEKAIEKVRSNMHAKVERTAAELETRTAAVEENLRKTYAENKAQWVETITDAVTEA